MIKPKLHLFPDVTEASRDKIASKTKDFSCIAVLSTRPPALVTIPVLNSPKRVVIGFN